MAALALLLEHAVLSNGLRGNEMKDVGKRSAK